MGTWSVSRMRTNFDVICRSISGEESSVWIECGRLSTPKWKWAAMTSSGSWVRGRGRATVGSGLGLGLGLGLGPRARA